MALLLSKSQKDVFQLAELSDTSALQDGRDWLQQ